jgi:hypothetical protein
MLVYEFYRTDEIGNTHLIGILPERRKDQARINNESIMNWIYLVIGNRIGSNNISFTKVNLNNLFNSL